ncbi:unnamed protein product [Didymodactylos carnosus]|uniref:Uncharacterized protein n=1 Tax=Didymodactylos carnosus TaxID=1234261 RepID=A0A813XJC7_9BILA|nr:unnamed protein product [Didymodactylos carnosus]CAF0872378.1 unnamed protein product [Didymodactylos carnosus]CAF3625884.1 unnamed protein product [Didymodactylos carnosus]CAF3659638.1 unnamed protein product [Didymodactylos carnosus]
MLTEDPDKTKMNKKSLVVPLGVSFQIKIDLKIIVLSDLESDLMNVRQCCEKLNRLFLPEAGLHLLLTILFLFNGNWFVFLLNVPMDLWSIYKYFMRQKSPGQLGYYDPLEINNNRKIKSHMQELLVRLAFYLIGFFVYLFLLIHALI